MKTVYMCFSTDVLHAGHMNIIQKAAQLGEITAGILCEEEMIAHERFPLLPQTDRIHMLESIKGISRVVVQTSIYYDEILRELRPDYVVHGDNWQRKGGYLEPVRQRVIDVLKEWGGQLVEFPYYQDESLEILNSAIRDRTGRPETRRRQLRKMLGSGRLVRILEAHDGLSALLVERCRVEEGTKSVAFDGLWVSSLCDSTVKGKPDIELIDLTSRLHTVGEMAEVTSKPIIFDADTGGKIEHFRYNIRTLERAGVSAVIVEDKKGLKHNSLLGNDVEQHQESLEDFCEKLTAGKRALQDPSFVLIARIESLILEQGIEDALRRAHAYRAAGADAVMIHSRSREPEEIFAFCEAFRQRDPNTPIVVVPTTYHAVTEEELHARGINMVIYANHLLRAAFPAMKKTAEAILKYHRALEADAFCLPVGEILTMIPQS